MATPDKTVVDVDGHHLTISNLDKVLYPGAGTTKRDVIAYYSAVAPYMLEHLGGRPVTFRRAPDGIDGQIFFEKHVPRGAPGWLPTITVSARGPRESKRPGETIEYPAIDTLAALVWAANLAALEFHTPMWRLNRSGEPQKPDLLVFDLDPGAPATIRECCAIALVLRDALEHEKLSAYPKTSGGKGMQLYVPIPKRRRNFDSLEYAHALARAVEKEHPALVLSNMKKELRKGKVFIDWSQNNTAKTTVTPYSLRIADRPYASTPLAWPEVERVADGAPANELRFEAADVIARVSTQGDLFAPVLG